MVVRSPKMFHYKTKKETGLLENYTSPPLKLKCKITSDQVAQKQWHDCVHTVTTGDAGEHNLVSFMSRPSSVQSLSPTLRPQESQHARPPCPSPTPGVHSDSRPSSQ